MDLFETYLLLTILCYTCVYADLIFLWPLCYVHHIGPGQKFNVLITLHVVTQQSCLHFCRLLFTELIKKKKIAFLPPVKEKTNVNTRISPGMRCAALPVFLLHRPHYVLFVPIIQGHGNIFCNRKGP